MFKYAVEKFMPGGPNGSIKESLENMTGDNTFLLFVIMLLVILTEVYIIQLLWNNVLTTVVKCKKITLMQALGIKILVSFLAN